MIELGKIQKLQVVRETKIGAYLNSKDSKDDDDILLPKNQIPQGIKIGDEIEVFVYKDSEDRSIATVKKPKITIDDLAILEVVQTTKIGAFLNWGLEKDLFLPFREQIGEVKKGDKCLVGMYVDNSERLCATMNIYNLLSTESPYKKDDRAKGMIYSISKEFGAFVAVENKYHGMIPNKELFENYNVGDIVDVRVKNIREDGKLDLSVREKAYNEIENDAQKILDRLKQNGGSLKINDKSSPDAIKAEFAMSKAAFKRAVGRLMKEGAVEITENGIKLRW